MKTKINILAVLCVLLIAFVNGFSSTEQVFYDDFETSTGWVRNAYGTDNATTGLWERDDPEGTFYGETMQLNSTVSGTKCLCTGPLSGDYPGSYDIDDGKTTVRSSAIQLPSDGNLTLSFYYNFAHYSNATSADYFRVKIIGNTTVQVLEVLGSATVAGGIWKTFSTNLNSFSGQSIYVFIEVADDMEPSLVEAAVEDVLIVKETIVPPGEEDSLVVTGKIMLHPYNNDTLPPVQLFSEEVEDFTSFKINVPPSTGPRYQLYQFDDLAFRTTAQIIGNEIFCSHLMTQGTIACDSMRTGELWVTTNIYPDYVFKDKNYKLKSLSEIADYIQKEKHLEGIPTEEEAKEGFSVGKMQVKLLEKIEEMTLLMIQMDKRIKELEDQLNSK